MEVAASVVGLLMAGGKIASILQEFLSSIKNAPAIAKRLDDEVNQFRYIMLKIQQTVIEGETLNPNRAALIDLNHLCASLTAAVTTFSELEKELDRIKARGTVDFWDRVKWSRAEKKLLNISLRLNRHETSLTLIFTILTSESVRLALSRKERLSSEFDAQSLAASQESEAGSQSIVDSTDTTSDILVVRHEFESSLSSSRAYRRTADSVSLFTLDTLRTRVGRWSMYTAYSNDSVFSMPISLRETTGISLAEKSIAPVLLPIAVDTIYHNEYYRDSHKTHESVWIQTPRFALYFAASEGRYEEVRDLLRRGSYVNECGPNGDTALDIAVQNLHIHTVKTLLLFNARPDPARNYSEFIDHARLQGDKHITPMMKLRGSEEGNIDPIFKQLLRVDVLSPEVERTLLTLSKSHALGPEDFQIQLEVDLCVLAKVRDEAGLKSVIQHSRCLRDGLHTVHKLLLKDRLEELISFALWKVDLLEPGPDFTTALRRRVEEKSLLLIGLLFGVNTYGSMVEGSLRGSLQPSDIAIFRCLLDAGFCEEAILDDYNSPLGPVIISTEKDAMQASLHQAVINDDAESVDLLSTQGVDINTTNVNGETALHLAIQEGHEDIALTLIERGADISTPNMLGNTPLILAAAHHTQRYRFLICRLLDKGANINVAFDNGETLLHLAAEYGWLYQVEIFLERGIDWSARDCDGRTADQCTQDTGIKDMIRETRTRHRR
ncbi:hypothetical protein DFP73DRAFT_567261 [Morchella snyderi]|nr:hypothetical protein DFP73DRAFT_567261 [Morchella snyderi]